MDKFTALVHGRISDRLTQAYNDHNRFEQIVEAVVEVRIDPNAVFFTQHQERVSGMYEVMNNNHDLMEAGILGEELDSFRGFN